MEIIHEGSQEVFELDSMGCCYPPGSMSSFHPGA